MGEINYDTASFARAAPGVVQWQQRLDRAAQRGELSFRDNTILHRGNDALVVRAMPAGRVDSCYIAGQDLADVALDPDATPFWTIIDRPAAAQFVQTEQTPPEGADRAVLFHFQTWQPF